MRAYKDPPQAQRQHGGLLCNPCRQGGQDQGGARHDHSIDSMIYTTNWIERLQKDFRRVTRMRGAMPNEESVLLLMGKTAMDKKSYLRQVPRIDLDETLFPPEKAAPQPEYTTSGCYDPKLRELAEMARSASAVAEDDKPKEN